jgi:hypothetical protein
VFLNVTVCGALVVPATTLPKFTVVTEIVVCAPARAEEHRQEMAISVCRRTLLNSFREIFLRSDIGLPSATFNRRHAIGRRGTLVRDVHPESLADEPLEFRIAGRFSSKTEDGFQKGKGS